MISTPAKAASLLWAHNCTFEIQDGGPLVWHRGRCLPQPFPVSQVSCGSRQWEVRVAACSAALSAGRVVVPSVSGSPLGSPVSATLSPHPLAVSGHPMVFPGQAAPGTLGVPRLGAPLSGGADPVVIAVVSPRDPTFTCVVGNVPMPIPSGAGKAVPPHPSAYVKTLMLAASSMMFSWAERQRIAGCITDNVAQVATLLTAECILFRIGAGVPYLLHFRGVPLAGPEGKPPGPVDQCWFKELVRLQYSILPASFKVEASDAPTSDPAPIGYLRDLHEARGIPYPIRLEGIAHAIQTPPEGIEASLANERAARVKREAAAAAAMVERAAVVKRAAATAATEVVLAPAVVPPLPLASGAVPVQASGSGASLTPGPLHTSAVSRPASVVSNPKGPSPPVLGLPVAVATKPIKHHPPKHPTHGGPATASSSLKHHPPSAPQAVLASGVIPAAAGATTALGGPPTVLCGDRGNAVIAAVLVRTPKVGMVMLPPAGLKRTGGRARLRARLQRDLGAPPSPALDDLSPEALLIRVAHRVEVVRLRRLRRADLVLMRALLLRWESDSGDLAAEVHSERWFPHKWVHWVFPHATSDPQEHGPATAVSFRTVADFVSADTFGWREVLQRVVGKAEVTPGGLGSLFPPDMLGRIDTFVSTFAEAHARHAWLHLVLNRIRRLRAWQGPLAPGPISAVSRLSRKARLLGKERAALLNLERLRRFGREELGTSLTGVDGGLAPISEASVCPPRVGTSLLSTGLSVAPRPHVSKPWAPYLRRRPGNALIHGLLHGADLVPVGYSKPLPTSVRLRSAVAST